jgi:protein-disulfide isomerase
MPDPVDEGAALTVAVSEQRDHILGPRTAAVTLVEYGDFECPYCREAHGILQQLLAGRGHRVRLVFRHFPLRQMHPHAQHAAEAAEAAAAQGRFWEMHDLLYERQEALADDDLVGYADELGLDVGRFQAELWKHVYADRIREDFMGGVRSGVNGTPTFFINGRRHDGAWDLHSLSQAIDGAAHWQDEGHRPAQHHRHA